MKIGSQYRRDGCRFTVWAPFAEGVSLAVVSPARSAHPMEALDRGYWTVTVPSLAPGDRYFFDLGNSVLRPDPASHFQPEGVHGPSEIVDHSSFRWEDCEWRGFSLKNALIYELHTGTFTPEGTFEAIIPRLGELRDLGVTAIELMPVAQFSGSRNWGYDGTYLFAPQNSYGGPGGLKTLVNACHGKGIAVILDVVYNHLGPEGNYLSQFGPYFSNRCATPWGMSVNFDGEFSDEVRRFVTANALFWFCRYHIDALRLDAVQHIYDQGARHILRELSEKTLRMSGRLRRPLRLIAESDLNDVRIIDAFPQGGYGIDAQWLDDFHHCIHALLTGESSGYYADYGSVSQLAKALEQGFIYSWTYSPSRKKHYGSSSRGFPPASFVVFNQNHDQIGNRLWGERLSALVPFEALKLAAGILLLLPYVPLIFMGEEFAEDAPFLYFVDHSDRKLVRAVEEGRKQEFRSFDWSEPPPLPQSAQTFAQSKIRWQRRDGGKGRVMREYYRALVAARSGLDTEEMARVTAVDEEKRQMVFSRGAAPVQALMCVSFSREPSVIRLNRDGGQSMRRLVDSAQDIWGGPGVTAAESLRPGSNSVRLQPYNFVMYRSG